MSYMSGLKLRVERQHFHKELVFTDFKLVVKGAVLFLEMALVSIIKM